MNKSIEELHKIMAMEGLDRKSGAKARTKALEEWIEEWIVDVNYEQSVIKRGLTSEDEDFIKYYMAYKIGDELMNECIDVKTTPTKISTQLLALRR